MKLSQQIPMTNNGMGNALTLTLHSRFRPNHVLVEEDSFELLASTTSREPHDFGPPWPIQFSSGATVSAGWLLIAVVSCAQLNELARTDL